MYIYINAHRLRHRKYSIIAPTIRKFASLYQNLRSKVQSRAQPNPAELCTKLTDETICIFFQSNIEYSIFMQHLHCNLI